jgi:hypothetical protein
MRTSFHHQPEAQHPNFQLSTSWQADYPIFRWKSGRAADITGTTEFGPNPDNGVRTRRRRRGQWQPAKLMSCLMMFFGNTGDESLIRPIVAMLHCY